MPEFVVSLRRGNGTRRERVTADGRHLAVNMAERMEADWQATDVTETVVHRVVGRCLCCRSIVFADECRARDGQFVRCPDC